MKTKRTGAPAEGLMRGLFFAAGMAAILCVVFITVYLFAAGLPAIRQIGLKEFLLGRVWASTAETPQYGILPFLLTSLWGTAGAVALGAPVGVLAALFLARVAPPALARPVEAAVELLAGIPSVIYGLMGMTVLVPFLSGAFGLASGACLLAAVLVLAVIILPGIISVSVTALNALPKEYEEASLALGATAPQTWFRVSLPAARSGIAAGVVLGVGRAMGEAMAVMMVAGNVANMPGLFKSVRFLTTAIASEMGYASGLQRQALFGIALVLFVFIMGLNAFLNLVLKGGEKHGSA